jgi:hypothetical protein
MFGLVLIMALAISGWSLFGLAVLLHIPYWLAVVTSVAYDGAAIYLGTLSIEYAKSEDSSATTKFLTYLLIGISAVLNAFHANLMNLGAIGMAMYGLPSIFSGFLFEEGLKFENKTELRNRGRVTEPLSLIPKIAWLRFPLKAFKKQSKEILTRYLESPQEAVQSLREAVAEESISALVQKFYTEGIRTTDELFPLVQKAKSDEITKQQVSKALSYAKKKLGD